VLYKGFCAYCGRFTLVCWGACVVGSTAAVQQQPTLGQQFNLLPTQEKVDILFGR